MFNKKSKQIKDLSEKNYKLEKELQSVKQLCSYKKEDYNDFILILNQIQEANNFNTGNYIQSRKKAQRIIENIVTLSIEETQRKIKELD